MDERVTIRAPLEYEGDERVCGWVPVGWPDPAGLGTWVRHHPTSVEVSTSELVVETLRPDLEQAEPPGRIRVYLYARACWGAGCTSRDEREATVLRLPAAVVIDTGTEQVRLDLPGADALGTALHTLTGRPRERRCRCAPSG
jgi:hypothetical protein